MIKRRARKPSSELKILCVADHIDPLVYSVNAKDRFRDVDMVLSAGDLNMNYLGFISSILNKPLLFVFGNHNLKHYQRFKHSLSSSNDDDVPEYAANYFGSTYIGDRVVRVKGLIIAGMGGSIRYNDGENQYTDRQMTWKLIRLIPRLVFNKVFFGRYLDILLTHSPPRFLGDREDPTHRGFTSFLWFMRWFSPRYLLHGHVHLYDPNEARERSYYRTTLINVYDHYVLKYPIAPPEAEDTRLHIDTDQEQ